MARSTVAIGFLGTTLDVGTGPDRWERWRPTVSLCQQDDLLVSRLELLHPSSAKSLAKGVAADIAAVSPETAVRRHAIDIDDPWDFESVYSALDDFARGYDFKTDVEDYLVHISTGTHVAQICLFLLTESRRFPARLVQTAPRAKTTSPQGDVRIIDLDLSRYDRIAARFERERRDNVSTLKSGIATGNVEFNRLVGEIEHVATGSTDPILLMGPTGAGKSQLAKRIADLKRQRHQCDGAFVEVNCATLRGDGAMSTLFGHKKGSFTGAASDRPGLLRSADGGVLFLDEIGELGLDEQAMLLRALEEKRFLPLGADAEVTSRFQLIAGTNRDLALRVAEGRFREDLFARINLWTFRLPALRERPEDIEPNVDFELDRFADRSQRVVRFSREARDRYLAFARSAAATWSGNFRDLSASITRLATLAAGGRISVDDVDREIERLERSWRRTEADPPTSGPALAALLSPDDLAAIDRFDRMQLESVIEVCRSCRTISDAGRELYQASRLKRREANDADRLRKYLARFGLDWSRVTAASARR
ncbi:MAG: sigma 54-interacting transcriptional regulator [Phycisphaerae bacterium]|nr:sigma 54-interacting transcriptional regulator [Phycisphaerae bacterium]